MFVHRRPRAAPPCLPAGGAGAAANDAVPLVLLHGLLLSHWSFAGVVDALAQARPLILLDLPGHGESDRQPGGAAGDGAPLAEGRYGLPGLARSVVATLDALGVERAALLGHSLGGAVALTIAAHHPQRCERLILCGAALFPFPPSLLQRLPALPGLGRLLREHHGPSRRMLRRLFEQHLFRDPALVSAELLDYYWERLSRAGGAAALHACLRTLTHLDPRNPDFARVVAPTLLVWGDEDRAVPLSRGRRLLAALPSGRARLAVVPACGHTPFMERPAAFCQAVLPFLAGQEAPGEGLMLGGEG